MSIASRTLASRARLVDAGSFAQPAGWFASWLRGEFGESDVGFEVTEQSALRLSTVWGCIKVIAEDVAKLPLFLYERTGTTDSDRKRADDHPLYTMLRYDASPEVSSQMFRETVVAHALQFGNGYAEIERARSGRPVAVHILHPRQVMPDRNNRGELVYHVQSRTRARSVTLDAADVFHLTGLSPDGIVGYSPIQIAARAIGLGQAAERLAARLFKNGAVPGGVLEHPAKLGPDALASLRASVEKGFTGQNAGRPMILEEGMTWKSMSMPLEDLQFIELRKFQLPEICRLYRVPLHKVGVLDRATFSNIEHQSIEYVTDTLMPWLERVENEVRRKLLMPVERSRYFAEHLADSLLRGDTKARFEAYKVGREGGWFSANEIRAKENMPARTDPGGEEYLTPLNMAGSKKDGPNEKDEDDARSDDPQG